MTRKLSITTLTRLGHGANDMYWFILPTALPLILAEHGFSYTAAGAFLTAFLGVIAVMSFFMGRLADRISRSALIYGGFYVASSALIAAGSVHSFVLFMVSMVAAAIGISTFHPVTYAVIDESGLERRGRMYAHFELYGAAGILTLLVLNGLLINRIGWQGVVLIACVPGFIVGTLFARNRAIFEHRIDESKRESTDAIAPEAQLAETAPQTVIVVFFASIALRTVAAMAIMNFLPTFLARSVGLKPSLAAFTAGFLFLGGIIVSLFAGNLADRFGPIKVLQTASIGIGLFLILSTRVLSAWMLPFSLLIMGAAISAALPAQNLILSALSPSGRKGKVFGTSMGVMTIANSLGPLALGLIADRIGLTTTFRVASIPVLMSFVLVIIVSRNKDVKNLR